MDSDAADQSVIQIIRTKFNNTWNAYNPGFVVSEANNGVRNFHCYGNVPAYFFSAYLLGVQTELPVSSKRITIQPRLADLTRASGTVVTEYGLVPVSWTRSTVDTTLDFTFTIPTGSSARVGIPLIAKNTTLLFDNTVWISKGTVIKTGVSIGNRFIYLDTVAAGAHTGRLQPGSMQVVGIVQKQNASTVVQSDVAIKAFQNDTKTMSVHFNIAAGIGNVTIDLYSLQGCLVRSLSLPQMSVGAHVVNLAYGDNRGQPLQTGNYCCRVRGPGFDKTLKIMVSR
jgi:hypothetical protein